MVTFGSPSFLSNLTDAEKMKNFTSYFYHIKEDFDYIPEIIDYINHDNFCKNASKTLTQNLLEKMELNKNMPDPSQIGYFCYINEYHQLFLFLCTIGNELLQ